jgi:hypothetical protein
MRNTALMSVEDQPAEVQVEYDIATLGSMACMVHDRLMNQLGSSTNDNARLALAYACLIIEKCRDLEMSYAMATRNRQVN